MMKRELKGYILCVLLSSITIRIECTKKVIQNFEVYKIHLVLDDVYNSFQEIIERLSKQTRTGQSSKRKSMNSSGVLIVHMSVNLKMTWRR